VLQLIEVQNVAYGIFGAGGGAALDDALLARSAMRPTTSRIMYAAPKGTPGFGVLQVSYSKLCINAVGSSGEVLFEKCLTKRDPHTHTHTLHRRSERTLLYSPEGCSIDLWMSLCSLITRYPKQEGNYHRKIDSVT